MKLVDYCKQEGVRISLTVIGQIVGRHPNYLNVLWKNGGEDRQRVKAYIADAVVRFDSICIKR